MTLVPNVATSHAQWSMARCVVANKFKSRRHGLALAMVHWLAFTLTGGCAIAPGHKMQSGEIVTVEHPSTKRKLRFEVTLITPELVDDAQVSALASGASEANSGDRQAYRIGPADVLAIVVWNHPELTTPASRTDSSEQRGFVVDADGTIFFPYAGVIPVAGKTASEVRQLLTEALDPYIENPQLDVSVAQYRSQPIYILGEVLNPTAQFIDKGEVTLAEVIARASGVNPSTSNPDRIYVIRGNALEPKIFWLKGESPVAMTLAKQFPLQAHDVVYVATAGVTRWNRVLSQILPTTSFVTGTAGTAAGF
ncbi:MAG: polysaccharide biosynthesis/export family protein [Gammaproteobacteria bacterium]|nr:polysaccharide biosynthesis/export family protein [Gammaproteobacteria bacterium]